MFGIEDKMNGIEIGNEVSGGIAIRIEHMELTWGLMYLQFKIIIYVNSSAIELCQEWMHQGLLKNRHHMTEPMT